jgi:hypothetical protein
VAISAHYLEDSLSPWRQLLTYLFFILIIMETDSSGSNFQDLIREKRFLEISKNINQFTNEQREELFTTLKNFTEVNHNEITLTLIEQGK